MFIALPCRDAERPFSQGKESREKQTTLGGAAFHQGMQPDELTSGEERQEITFLTLFPSLPPLSCWSSPLPKFNQNPEDTQPLDVVCTSLVGEWIWKGKRREPHTQTTLVIIQGQRKGSPHQVSSKNTIGSKIQSKISFWFYPSILLARLPSYSDYQIQLISGLVQKPWCV